MAAPHQTKPGSPCRPAPAVAISPSDGTIEDMKKTLLIAVAACALMQVHTRAWGVAGHRVVSRAAILALPADVPPFLARQIDWIGSRSVLADSWRAPTEPFAKASEDPRSRLVHGSVRVLEAGSAVARRVRAGGLRRAPASARNGPGESRAHQHSLHRHVALRGNRRL